MQSVEELPLEINEGIISDDNDPILLSEEAISALVDQLANQDNILASKLLLPELQLLKLLSHLFFVAELHFFAEIEISGSSFLKNTTLTHKIIVVLGMELIPRQNLIVVDGAGILFKEGVGSMSSHG